MKTGLHEAGKTEVEQKVESFFAAYPVKIYKKGDMLIQAGENPEVIFLLQQGIVKQYSISRKGDEFVINLYKKGAFFPLLWAVAGGQNMYFFEALADTHVRRAPKDEVIHFLKSNPDVLYDLITRLFRGIDGLLSRMSHLMTGTAYDRLLSELILYAKRFGSVDEVSGATVVKVTETELATHAGLTRETVSREMKALKENGLITFLAGTITIPSVTALESELIGDFEYSAL